MDGASEFGATFASGFELVVEILRVETTISGEEFFQFFGIGDVIFGESVVGVSKIGLGLDECRIGLIVFNKAEIKWSHKICEDGLIGATKKDAGADVGVLQMFEALFD